MIDIPHHHDHASILLDGDLDWPRTHNLVHAIETAVEHYLYGLVEIRIPSRGGSNEPLGYLLECLRTWREKGAPSPQGRQAVRDARRDRPGPYPPCIRCRRQETRWTPRARQADARPGPRRPAPDANDAPAP